MMHELIEKNLFEPLPPFLFTELSGGKKCINFVVEKLNNSQLPYDLILTINRVLTQNTKYAANIFTINNEMSITGSNCGIFGYQKLHYELSPVVALDLASVQAARFAPCKSKYFYVQDIFSILNQNPGLIAYLNQSDYTIIASSLEIKNRMKSLGLSKIYPSVVGSIEDLWKLEL